MKITNAVRVIFLMIAVMGQQHLLTAEKLPSPSELQKNFQKSLNPPELAKQDDLVVKLRAKTNATAASNKDNWDETTIKQVKQESLEHANAEELLKRLIRQQYSPAKKFLQQWVLALSEAVGRYVAGDQTAATDIEALGLMFYQQKISTPLLADFVTPKFFEQLKAFLESPEGITLFAHCAGVILPVLLRTLPVLDRVHGIEISAGPQPKIASDLNERIKQWNDDLGTLPLPFPQPIIPTMENVTLLADLSIVIKAFSGEPTPGNFIFGFLRSSIGDTATSVLQTTATSRLGAWVASKSSMPVNKIRGLVVGACATLPQIIHDALSLSPATVSIEDLLRYSVKDVFAAFCVAPNLLSDNFQLASYRLFFEQPLFIYTPSLTHGLISNIWTSLPPLAPVHKERFQQLVAFTQSCINALPDSPQSEAAAQQPVKQKSRVRAASTPAEQIAAAVPMVNKQETPGETLERLRAVKKIIAEALLNTTDDENLQTNLWFMRIIIQEQIDLTVKQLPWFTRTIQILRKPGREQKLQQLKEEHDVPRDLLEQAATRAYTAEKIASIIGNGIPATTVAQMLNDGIHANIFNATQDMRDRALTMIGKKKTEARRQQFINDLNQELAAGNEITEALLKKLNSKKFSEKMSALGDAFAAGWKSFQESLARLFHSKK